MMTVILTLAAIAISALAAAHLAYHDPKRRRAFSEPPREGRPRRAEAWTLIYLPGVVFLVFDQWTAFMMWIGGAPLVSWLLVAQSPQFYRWAGMKWSSFVARTKKLQLREWMAGVIWPRLLHEKREWHTKLRLTNDADAAQRVADLELRVAELELKLSETSPAREAPSTVGFHDSNRSRRRQMTSSGGLP
ncbi:hypothetical protein [Nisaea sp.]|uniref:hypothetical protein n=1 Tax=Nisaea sp. TaxID=2024842 RepID=UPI003299867F